ncbi:MAG TPA: septation protein SpoVG family protein [Candidatus Saccharimonadales bacterium]
MEITEIEILIVKPQNGLVAFASFVINGSVYCGSVGVMSRPNGDYRLLYPTKIVAGRQLDIFHPISKEAGQQIHDAVIAKFEDVVNNGRNRYGSAYSSRV